MDFIEIKEGDPEIWKPCPGFEKMYDISSYGNVRSFHVGNGRIDRNSEPKFRKPSYSPTFEYWYVNLRKREAGKQFVLALHILVAKAFVNNPDPKIKKKVNHKNGEKECNAAWNLEWCTSGENQKHAYETGLRKRPNGTLNGRCKLTETQVLEIFSSSENHYKLASIYSVSPVVIANIKKGKIWSSVTGKKFIKKPPIQKPSKDFILAIYNATGTQKEIAAKFGVSSSKVGFIKSGRSFSDITGHIFIGARKDYYYYGVKA